MRKSVFTLLAAGSLFGSSLFIDSSSGLHSSYLRDGMQLSRTVSATQALYFEFPERSFWFDASGFTELKEDARYFAEYSIGSGRALSGTLYLDAFLGIYSPQFTTAELEMQLQLSGEAPVPWQLRTKYSPGMDLLYASLDSYRSFDLTLPVYLSVKVGALQKNTQVYTDAEVALSSYMSLGPYLLEPYISFYSQQHSRRSGLIFNLSFSTALAQF